MFDNLESTRHIWKGWRFQLTRNIKTGDLNGWAWTMTTHEDKSYRGFKPPDDVCNALNAYIHHDGYADLDVVDYLNKIFKDDFATYYP